MAEKTLYSRIQLKGDSYSNWTTQDPVLLKNEVAIVTIANEDGAPVNKPGVYFKVGDGTSTFSQLGFTSGIAGAGSETGSGVIACTASILGISG